MMITYKYLLRPDVTTEAKLLENIDAFRFVYNHTLERLDEAKRAGLRLSDVDLINELPALKKEHLFLAVPYSHALQNTIRQLFANIRVLGALKKKGLKVGRLRFKNRDRYKSFRYNSQGYKVDVENGMVHLAKIGEIPFELHRPLSSGEVVGVIVKHSGGKWYVSFQIDVPVSSPREKTGKVVGIDLGLKSYAVDTDGRCFENPRYFRKSEKRTKKLQRSLSRKKKGSSNREKAKWKLARAHDKVENQRRDHAHKLSIFYVDNYDVIVVEDLNVKALKEKGNNNGLHKSISDAGWSRFLQCLDYKAEGAGRQLIRIPPRGTTQNCSNCGEVVPKTLKDRTHECPYCGYTVDRDFNAARNILIAGVGHAEEPAEPKPLLHISVEQALTMKQEATTL